MKRRLFGRRDEAVTEVIGYVLSFALSAIFLLLALNVFWAARANTEAVTTGVELKTIADRVAARIVEMGAIAQEFPNATMNATLVIPQSLSGKIYTIEAQSDEVTARLNDGSLSFAATTFKLDETGVDVDGDVDSSNERVIIEYHNGIITILGG
ncbi:MAG TPA: hypothetical protein VM370_07420 [Candidatus Thermoplasmatota archaeon]|nr:hypothetical protein [Candidatus Thermoplasmatota archaeon]